MNGHPPARARNRYPFVPPRIEVPLTEQVGDEGTVEIDLTDLPDDVDELSTLLEQEHASQHYWILSALAYAKHQNIDNAIEILNSRALNSENIKRNQREILPIQLCLLWLYLQKTREAVKAPYHPSESAENTKDNSLQAATALLNNIGRYEAEHPAYNIARAVYSSLKAAVTNVKAERASNLENAHRIYEEAYKRANGTNMVALMGKAKWLFSKGRYEKALESYQEVLRKKPDMDPDPRIGIGLCFWMLNFKDDAKIAWERALELDPDSKVANLLLGVYHLSFVSSLPETDQEFIKHYKKGMTEHIAKAYKLDKNMPLACTLFATYFFSAGNFATAESLSKRAIEYTDVPQVARDAYYLLGRKYQEVGDYDLSRQCYVRSENAKEDIYLPSKLGAGQLRVLQSDFTGAKLVFENLVKTFPKCLEAMMILGTLYAEEAFLAESQPGAGREEKEKERKSAISYLETVRSSWKDPKKHMKPSVSVLLTLARLYELESQEKALACLQQVADLEREATRDEETMLAPQLLNNIGVFNYNMAKYDEAREHFQTALNNCVAMGAKDESLDTDALVTTLSYNLARLEEAAGNTDEAIKLYEGLLVRHSDYTDAAMRLSYIALRRGGDDGPKRLEELMKTEDHNLEVCALYGYYLSRRPKKSPLNLAEDKEQRHYKRTLTTHDKHDRYSLTGMGNLHLMTAREMRRDTDQDKEKKKKMYERAVEFFDKALVLDPKNAYAAQGVAIAMIEDKKDYSTGVGIFEKVKGTLKEASVHINLGHSFIEIKQFTWAIENYEIAINQYRADRDPWTVTALARAWYLKGKAEKSLTELNTALDYAKKALVLSPDHPIFMFNVAYLQAQIGQVVHELPKHQRTSEEIKSALEGVEEAIKTFTVVAKSKNPPYPAGDIEMRVTMNKNTTRRQLTADLEEQTKYEELHAAKIAEAKRKREAEVAKRAEEHAKLEAEKKERQKKLAEERKIMQDQAREWAEKREEEERTRDTQTSRDVDSDGGKKKRTRREPREPKEPKPRKEKGERKPRKKKADTETEEGQASRANKKRRLTKGGKSALSKAIISDSDDMLSNDETARRPDSESRSASLTPAPGVSPSPPRSSGKKGKSVKSKAVMDSDDDLSDGETDNEPAPSRRRTVVDSDEDEEMEDADAGKPGKASSVVESGNED
ncbi:hypothetical protein DRE_02910 [Drechslerella stenobrocha 248]|uniref:TPR-like protein n=1 Tax=Drechslerella stenobrocha 248 TaxID=1043628 RepID=W7IF57_9PEZI|nr:hypothetical protein DRE_02910 [Drechslerella stenobrocha 248]